jgi:hypothetical protein
MTSYFWSEEGQKAWDEIKLPYPKTVWDAKYEQFHGKTKHSPDDLNLATIGNLRRVLVGEKEYLVFDLTERRVDNLGNDKHYYRSNIGMYSIPIPQYRMVEDAEGYKERKVVGTAGIRTGYSIPFTKENVEKLVKKGWITPEDPKELTKRNGKRIETAAKHKAAIRDTNDFTRYSITSEGNRVHRTIPSHKDFIEGTFDELWNFGKAHVSKDDWDRLKAINEVAAAAKEQGNAHILQDINDALNRNKTEEGLYK